MTIAPPSMTTFCPRKPVRTNERSFDERRYSRAKMNPMTRISRNEIPTRIRISIRFCDCASPRPNISRPSFCVRSSEQVGPRIRDTREPAARDLADEQDARAAFECAGGVRLHHDVERLAVLVRHLRLRGIPLTRSASDDRGNAAD